MPRYQYVVLTNPVDGREGEFHRWYTETHLHDALRVPGFSSAQLFKIADGAQRAEPPYPWTYCALYDLETDDLQSVVDALAARYNTADMVISTALHPQRLGLIFEAVTGRLEAAV
ncbi:DUF4286 family protein [Nocardia stercoris]|uniref:DUF4286 family protein n=1 Tax=Nocardia stercoris TaxID=2483361 RepID=UPI0018F35E07|nr:DUF4286 family protein [Nocardia stercoris]